MNHDMDELTATQRIAAIHAAIAQGEQDIKARRFKRYTPELMWEMNVLLRGFYGSSKI